MELKWNDQHLELLTEKALYWKERQLLIISDLHIGKISYFRKHGVPVPLQGIKENSVRLNKLLSLYAVKGIIFTGDVFHNEFNQETEYFLEWMKACPFPFIIVKGNHDPVPLHVNNQFEFYTEEYFLEPFVFTHHPSDVYDGRMYISGHVHPVFKLYGSAGQSFRLPCFYLTTNQLILPSFGYFTGGYEINPQPDDQVFLVTGTKVQQMQF